MEFIPENDLYEDTVQGVPDNYLYVATMLGVPDSTLDLYTDYCALCLGY